jgi:transcriptional regulator with XRE-family HTH domain
VFTSNATDLEIEYLHKYVSKAVKEAREAKGMSQLELALTIGLKSGAFFGNAENNTNTKHFNIEHIYKISKALGVSMSEFMPIIAPE